MRNRIDDLNQYGSQNAERLRKALSTPVDPRLIAAPEATSSDREEDVQASVIAALRERGYRVLQTSVRFRLVKCESCGHIFRWHGSTGQTPGIPDIFARSDAWPIAMWVGIEIKGAKTRLRPEQAQLLADGGIELARTVAQAVAAVLRANDAVKERE